MEIKLHLASEAEKTQVWEMLSTYLDELSQYGEVDREYRFFDIYWVDRARWSYIIATGKRTAGFALVNTWSPSGNGTDFAVAEFYVLPEFRGTGVGERAVASLLAAHSGIWEVSVMANNAGAKSFWLRALKKAGVSEIETVDLDQTCVYRFASAL
ncbi:MAG: GNAT family N-acetyltransferase [Proteobacteria bacterium]|nr:MAG: GNAT family N-acetyltransferase [Pseudomonadota bacterium]